MSAIHPDLKKQARQNNKRARDLKRALDKAERRAWLRCFWSWPLGHEYVNVGTAADPLFLCVSCDKPRDEYAPELADLRH